MENVIIAIAAVALLAVQAHRNYLMVQAAKKGQVVPQVHVTVQPADIAEWPTVTVSNDIEIDYDRLELMVTRIIAALPVPVTAPIYPSIPMPTYPAPNYPIISEMETGTTTGNEVEINGVKGKQFPAR